VQAGLPDSRYAALDGLRGVAALIVVFYHCASAFYPRVVPAQSLTVPAWVDWPTGIFLNGPFAVYVFFVLSGFVLTNSSLKYRPHFFRDCLLRYLRLAVPATASIVIAWLLLSAFPDSAMRLRPFIPTTWLFETHQFQIPPVGAALREGFWRIFLDGQSHFNNVLWTMQTELLGSLGIFAFFQFIKQQRAVLLIAIGAALSTSHWTRPYLTFVLGALLCLIMRDGFTLGRLASAGLFAVGVVFGAQSYGFADRVGLGHLHLPPLAKPGDSNSLFYPLAAAAILASVLTSEKLQSFFSRSAFLFLGKISFPLYLVHVPLIYTVVAAAALHLMTVLAPGLKLTGILLLLLLLLSVAIACVFEYVIDQPVLRTVKRLRQYRKQKVHTN
jgi:peptidoglycan/LPS O-acetylase OafA/YrhL